MKTWKFKDRDSLKFKNMPDWVKFLWQNWRMHFDKAEEVLKVFDISGHKCFGELHYGDTLLCPNEKDEHGNLYPTLQIQRQPKTEYYRKNHDTGIWEYVPVDKNHIWWFQLDGSIRFAFMKYDMEFPKYVMIDEYTHLSVIKIIRHPITTVHQAAQWEDKIIFIMDELKRQAEANSTTEEDCENWKTYKFEII